MTTTISATISDDQAEFVEEEGVSKSKLLQRAIEQERKERRGGYSQISISQEYNDLVLTLRNYPTPVDSKNTEDAQYRIPLYKNPEGELVDRPPIKKEDHKEDVKLVKREDNDEICAVEVKNWEDHRDISLLYGEKSEDPYVVLDPKKI